MSISLVQNTSNNVPGNPMSLAFGSNVTAGNLLIVGVGSTTGGASNSTISLSDTLGNTYTSLGKVEEGVLSASGEIFYCIANSSGANTVTATYSSGSGIALHVAEFSGVSAVDQNAVTNDQTGTAADSGPVTTAFADELLLGWLIASGAPTAGTGWTLLSSQGATLRSALEYQIVSSTGTYDATFTLGSGKGGTPVWGLRITTFFSGANVQVTGVSSTAQVGTPTETGTANFTQTGVAATAQVGTLQLGVTATFSGISSTAAIGNVATRGDANASGSAPVTASVGNVTFTGTAQIRVTGIASTAALGQPVPAVAIPVTGIGATSHLGSFTCNPSTVLTGLLTTSATGTLSFHTTVNYSLTGIQAQTIVGTAVAVCNSKLPTIAFLG
jgi:predicted secreted protein